MERRIFQPKTFFLRVPIERESLNGDATRERGRKRDVACIRKMDFDVRLR